MASNPSLVKSPAAKQAIAADAIEPDVGMTSINGMKGVTARITASGRYAA